MSGAETWIASTEALARAATTVGAGPLALDTEADSFHHYREKVCLVQLSFHGADRLVDTLAGVDLAPLASLLADRSVRKILHGADYDLRLLAREHGITIAGLYDTMIAARLGGARSFGLAALLERHFGVVLDKRLQRADWSIRPLPEAMLDYAMLDTRYLEGLAGLLDERLAELGRRGWAEEEFVRLEGVRWTTPEPADAEAFRRVKGSGSLDGRGLALLRELFALRDASARERDVAPFRVAHDELLLRIARAAAAGRVATREFPAGWSGARAARWREAVERGLAVAGDRLPGRAERRSRRPPPERERRLRALKAERDRLAAALDIEPSVLAPHSLVERAVEEIERGADPAALPEMRRWQAAVLGPLLARG